MVPQKDMRRLKAVHEARIQGLEAEIIRWKGLAEGQAVESGQQDDQGGEVGPRRKRSESGGHSPRACTGPDARMCSFTPSDGFKELWDHVKAPLLLKFSGEESFVLLPRQLQELTPEIVAQIEVSFFLCASCSNDSSGLVLSSSGQCWCCGGTAGSGVGWL